MKKKDPKVEMLSFGDKLSGIPYEVVALHPLADESELLQRLEMRPDECTGCDLYWAFHDQLIFVAFFSWSDQGPFVSTRYVQHSEIPFQFNISTKHKPIFKSDIKKGLDFLSFWIENNGLPGKTCRGFLVISSDDACEFLLKE